MSLAEDEELIITVDDLVQYVKSEGIFLTADESWETLKIHPTNGTPRDDVLEIINENAELLLEWLRTHDYLDS